MAEDELSEHRKCLAELDYHIRSNRALIYLVTPEEGRVVDGLYSICARDDHNWTLLEWDIAEGLTCRGVYDPMPKQSAMDQEAVLKWFAAQPQPQEGYLVLVLKDMQKFWCEGQNAGQADKRVMRTLFNLSHDCRGKRKVLVVVGASLYLPTEFEKLAAVIDWPLPEPVHIRERIVRLLEHSRSKKAIAARVKTEYEAHELDDIVRAFQGMTMSQIEYLTHYLMIKEFKLDPVSIAREKKIIIRKSGLLDWIETKDGLESVGGLYGLKKWIGARRNAFGAEAVDYGLPANPKGVLLLGIQGGGKSLAAKAIANDMGLPLLRLDMGKMYSGVIGSSEHNIRSAIKVAESTSPAVLWVDELEKGLSGSGSSNMTDGGTASRVMGSILVWMQEKTAPVYIVATANDISSLPPELIRKGRFDEIFFVDLPSEAERAEIFKIHLQKRKRNAENFDITRLVAESNQFTGAEIEAAIVSALYDAFDADKRELLTDDIVEALKQTIPLAVTMSEKIEQQRKWAQTRARSASGSPPASTPPSKKVKSHKLPVEKVDDEQEL